MQGVTICPPPPLRFLGPNPRFASIHTRARGRRDGRPARVGYRGPAARDVRRRIPGHLCLSRDPSADVVSRAAVRRILLRRVQTASEEEIAKYAANTRRLLSHRFLDRADPPRQPTLVATGEHDTFTTPEMCRALAATCVDSWLAIVRRSDHLVHLERAPELVDLVTRFYAGQPITDLEYCRDVERVSSGRMSTVE